MNAKNDLLTTEQAGELLGIGSAAVRHLLKTGDLKAQNFGKKHWLIRRRHVESLVRKREEKAAKG